MTRDGQGKVEAAPAEEAPLQEASGLLLLVSPCSAASLTCTPTDAAAALSSFTERESRVTAAQVCPACSLSLSLSLSRDSGALPLVPH